MDPDADPYPSIIITDLQDANKKLIFLKKFSCILPYFFKVLIPYIIFKDKKSKRCHKSVEIRFFLLYLRNDRRIWIRIQSRIWIRIHTPQINGSRIQIREAQKHVDPEHCLLLILLAQQQQPITNHCGRVGAHCCCNRIGALCCCWGVGMLPVVAVSHLVAVASLLLRGRLWHSQP
jgi:hypothetical protein